MSSNANGLNDVSVKYNGVPGLSKYFDVLSTLLSDFCSNLDFIAIEMPMISIYQFICK